MVRGTLRSTTSPNSCLILLATIVAAWASSGCGRGAHADVATKVKPREPEVLKASVLVVQRASWPTIVRTQGSLIADEVTIVGAKVAGREVNFDLGDSVKK